MVWGLGFRELKVSLRDYIGVAVPPKKVKGSLTLLPRLLWVPNPGPYGFKVSSTKVLQRLRRNGWGAEAGFIVFTCGSIRLLFMRTVPGIWGHNLLLFCRVLGHGWLGMKSA